MLDVIAQSIDRWRYVLDVIALAEPDELSEHGSMVLPGARSKSLSASDDSLFT